MTIADNLYLGNTPASRVITLESLQQPLMEHPIARLCSAWLFQIMQTNVEESAVVGVHVWFGVCFLPVGRGGGQASMVDGM